MSDPAQKRLTPRKYFAARELFAGVSLMGSDIARLGIALNTRSRVTMAGETGGG